MAPIVDGLIPEYEGTVAIRKYNVEASDSAASLANEYGVQYVPTFVFLDADGETANVIIGEIAASELRDELDALK